MNNLYIIWDEYLYIFSYIRLSFISQAEVAIYWRWSPICRNFHHTIFNFLKSRYLLKIKIFSISTTISFRNSHTSFSKQKLLLKINIGPIQFPYCSHSIPNSLIKSKNCQLLKIKIFSIITIISFWSHTIFQSNGCYWR